ncbi:MAG: hypothetical protein AB6733_05410 [Clostridiaceae bacterium]
MNYIFIVIIVFMSLITFHNLYDLIKLNLQFKESTKNLEEGFLSLSDLSSLEERDFNNWCVNYFDYLGFSKTKDISSVSNAFVCQRDGSQIILLTSKFLNKATLSKLAGLMYSYDIKKGLIISTDLLDESLKDYINHFTPKLVINVIDGKELIRELRKLREKELSFIEYFT